MDDLYAWRTQFIQEKIMPMVTTAGTDLIAQHRQQGDKLLIITATNDFVTRPIADLLGIDSLIAVQAQVVNQQYTGKVIGTPSFASGKITRLRQWLVHTDLSLTGSYFYSDSINDLPLLKLVDKPVAVNADPQLAAYAQAHNWQQLYLLE